MIKLKPLLEIKSIPRITPEMVDDLNTKIFMGLPRDHIGLIKNIYTDLGYPSIPSLTLLKKMPQSDLNHLYKELNKLS